MIRYVDTNILIRIMTNDVPDLAQIAIKEIKGSRSGELVILDAVLVELFFILEFNKNYKFARDKIEVIFDGILAIPQFRISHEAKAAFSLYIDHAELDYTDCLLVTSAKGKKENAFSFDKDLNKVLN
jgi:predicted nucleic-acid-binding protein